MPSLLNFFDFSPLLVYQRFDHPHTTEFSIDPSLRECKPFSASSLGGFLFSKEKKSVTWQVQLIIQCQSGSTVGC